MIKTFRFNSQDFTQEIPQDFIQEAPTDHWQKLLWFLMKYYRYFFIALMITAFFSLTEQLLFNIIIEQFVELFEHNPSKAIFNKFFINTGIFCGVYVFLETAARFRDFIMAYTIPMFEGTVRIILENLALQQPYELYISKSDGEVATKIQEIADGISDIAEIMAMKIIPYTCFLIFCSGIILKKSKLYFGILMIYFLSLSIFCFFSFGSLSSLAKRSYGSQNKLSKILVDIFSNIFIVKAFKTLDNESKYFAQAQTNETIRYNSFLNKVNKIQFVLIICHLMFFIVVGNYVLLYQWYNGLLKPSEIVFLFNMGSYCGWVVFGFIQKITEIFTAIGQCRSSLDVFNRNLERKKIENNNNKIIEGAIEFKNVSYLHILKNVNFKIPKGKKVGIIGPSGSGKSTLVSLLLKIIDNDEGEILLDGVNIKEIDENIIKEKVNIVTQDNLIMDRSIGENISLGESYDEESMMKAAQKAQIGDLIKEKPDGLNFLVGNKGRRLSGGQKQRLNIARVLVRNPSIIICDEAGSALDPLNEMIIMDNLVNLYKDNTMIFITHDIPLTTHWDYVLVMDNGEIVEQGTPQDLKDAKGLYYRLLTGNLV